MSKTPAPNALGYVVILGGATFLALWLRDLVKGAPPSSVPPNVQNTMSAAVATKDPRVIRAASVALRVQGYTAAANALEVEAQKLETGRLT